MPVKNPVDQTEQTATFSPTHNAKLAQPSSSLDTDVTDKESKKSRRSPDMGDSLPAKEPIPSTSAQNYDDEPSIMYVEAQDEEHQPEITDTLITKEMIEEEQLLMKETEEDDAIIQAAAKEKIAVEAQEKRLKRLKHLLTQSEFFANFIHKRLESQKEEAKIESQRNAAADSNSKSRRRGKAKPTADSRLARDKELLDSQGCSSADVTCEKTSDKMIVNSRGLVVSTRQPKLLEGGVMRDYQLEGYEWLRLLYLNGVNGILADEMGLGKTIQTIALICHMVEKGMQEAFLIIGPLSTLSNWVSEFERFAPQIPVMLYHGNMVERKAMWASMNKRIKIKGCFKGGVLPVVVTSYEVAMKDAFPLQHRFWEMIAVDEGHRIKNHNCRLVRALKMYKCNNRLLLTGTPLQNNLTELWSLLNYLLPDIFSKLSVFESWFQASDLSTVEGDLDAESQRIVKLEEENNVVSTLHKILHPFMLRRVKADVELDLPPKKELLVFTPLTPAQDELYRALLSKSIADLLDPKVEEVEEPDDSGEPCRKRKRTCTQTKKNYKLYSDKLSLEEYEKRMTEDFQEREAAAILAKSNKKSYRTLTSEQGYLVSVNPCFSIMDMRKVVNHPFLLRFPVKPGTSELLVDEKLITSAGKMMVLDAMLAKLKEKGHKVLIFSQMCMMLDLIEEYMLYRKHSYCRLDGSRSVFDRKESIDKFNKDPDTFAFLLSTRAGGLGINLTAADTVIIYDSDWNPQCDLQAQDRCHRIGQTRPVVVYRLTTDGTVDRRMVERATGKRRLEKIVIKKGRFHGEKNIRNPDAATGVSAQELLDLLNSKDYVKTITSNGYVYSDAELEVLLDRSDLVKGTQPSPTEKASQSSHLYKII